jgi:hypothetical protein
MSPSGKRALDERVERPGAKRTSSSGAPGDLLDDRVAVLLAVGERQQRVAASAR